MFVSAVMGILIVEECFVLMIERPKKRVMMFVRVVVMILMLEECFVQMIERLMKKSVMKCFYVVLMERACVHMIVHVRMMMMKHAGMMILEIVNIVMVLSVFV